MSPMKHFENLVISAPQCALNNVQCYFLMSSEKDHISERNRSTLTALFSCKSIFKLKKNQVNGSLSLAVECPSLSILLKAIP